MKPNYLPPTYLESFVSYDNDNYFKDLIDIEWRGQIKSSANNRKFRIKYYGEILEKHNLIVGTDFAPSLIFAVDVQSGEDILLFDGCKHGYNAMLCDTYTEAQIKNRAATNFYVNKHGHDTFEIVVGVYNGIPYDEELEDLQNADGNIELVSGEIISADTLVRNGFDCLFITILDENGKQYKIVEEELA